MSSVPGPGGPSDGLLRAPQPWIDPLLARLYDVFPFDGDLPFYLDLARAQGGDVLEPACGSGRVLVPLVRAGNRVTGVDASPHMLALAREKLDGLSDEASGRARLVQGDLRSFDVGAGFGLAIVAVKSFGYLTTREEQHAALARISAHLRPGGLVALDLLNPTPAWLTEPAGSLKQDLAAHAPGLGTVVRTECVVRTDHAAQVRTIRSSYEVIDGEGRVSKRIVEWPLRFVHRFEAELLLERAGFEIEAVYGGYRGEPFDGDSPTLLVLGRRAS